MEPECNSIEDVRDNIDRIDLQIVSLLSERGRFVKQAARFKKTTKEVKAPARVEQVISKVVALAEKTGASPKVTASVYRAMIAAFIDEELAHHAVLTDEGTAPLRPV